MRVGPTAHDAKRAARVIWDMCQPMHCEFGWRHELGQRQRRHGRLLLRSRVFPNDHTVEVCIITLNLIVDHLLIEAAASFTLKLLRNKAKGRAYRKVGPDYGFLAC